MANDYSMIRSHIEKVIDGFENLKNA